MRISDWSSDVCSSDRQDHARDDEAGKQDRRFQLGLSGPRPETRGGQEVKTIALLLAATGLASCSGGNAPPAAEAPLHGRLLTLDTHLDTPMHFERAGWNFADRHELAPDLSPLDHSRMKVGNTHGGFSAITHQQWPDTHDGTT